MKSARACLLFLLLISLLLLSATCDGDNSFSEGKKYKGKVVGIADGDTFTLLTAEKSRSKYRFIGCIQHITSQGTVAPNLTNKRFYLTQSLFASA